MTCLLSLCVTVLDCVCCAVGWEIIEQLSIGISKAMPTDLVDMAKILGLERVLCRLKLGTAVEFEPEVSAGLPVHGKVLE